MRIQLLSGRTERLFRRFRASGDAGALAEVFDRTAPELLRLASSLTRDPGRAHDLLQATFLAAIESAGAWDAARRLEPWLVGILVREARMLRRREGRALDPERLERGPVADPARTAEESELAEALSRALATLPPKYRDVLVPYLRDDKRGKEIASELGRSPGAVRVQIHRGLGLLRKALPAGFAAAGALALGSPRALGQVRARVLEAARNRAPASITTGATASGTTLLGGIAMTKLSLATLAALLAGGALWLALGGGAEPSGAIEPSGADDTARLSEPSRSGLEPSPLGHVDVATGNGGGEARTLATGTREPERATVGAGLSGRLVEVDGTPVPDTVVALLEVPPAILETDAVAAFDGGRAAPTVVLAVDRTDEEGRFRMDGATDRAVHALGVDLGGRRSTLRVLEQAFHVEEVVDLGDVVLPPVRELVGRVVDGEGNPIAGARVRVADLPADAAELDLQRVGPSSLLVGVEDRDDEPFAVELPAWVLGLVDRLPVPTARTDADGRFALDAPVGVELLFSVDEPRFQPLLRPGVRVSAAEAPRDLGDVVLRAGRTLACRVLDADGKPVADAEVFSGTLAPCGFLAVCRPAEAAGDGRYVATGGSDAPDVHAVRAGPGMPWTVVGPFRDSRGGIGERTVRLPARRDLVLRVEDEGGEPVAGFELCLEATSFLSEEEEVSFLRGWTNVTASLRAVDATTFALDGVAEGEYSLLARADGFPLVREEVRVEGEHAEARVVFRAPRPLTVRATEAGSGAPVVGAEVVARAGRRGRYTVVARGRTGAGGEASLQRVETTRREDLQVRVEREGYALAAATVAEDEERVELALVRPGSVIGRVHEGGRASEKGWMVALQPEGADELRTAGNIPWHAATDAGGRFRITNVPPGLWRYEVAERFLDGDPLAQLAARNMGEYFDADKGHLEQHVARGRIEVLPGQEALLDVDLSPAATGRTSLVRGSLVRDGRGLSGMEVHLDADGLRRMELSDSSGRFDFGAVPAGPVRVKIEDRKADHTIYRHEFRLAEGEERVLHVSLDPVEQGLRLVHFATGEPVADAALALESSPYAYGREDVESRTGPDGRTRVVLPGSGRYRWQAELQDGARSLGELRVQPDMHRAEIVLAFRPVVPFEGTVDVDPALLGDAEQAVLIADPAADDSYDSAKIGAIDLDTLTFALQDVLPGTYDLEVYCDRRRSEKVRVEVPAEGLTGARLAFELKSAD